MVEYARNGLIGLLTPQANTTVEPEFSILMPPGYAFLNARLVSERPDIESRLGDYFDVMGETTKQFANAPVGVYAFACTGASYLQGIARERAAVEAIEAERGHPFVTAGRAVADALTMLGARRIGLVSPYPEGLTQASIAYWQGHGFGVAAVSNAFNGSSDFHPIYSLAAEDAGSALSDISGTAVDAVVMLGTGMPTLGPILVHASASEMPVLSCMSALAWRSLAVFDPNLMEPDAGRRYFAGEGWRDRYLRAMGA